MNPDDRHLVEPRRLTLRDGREVTIRLLETTDAESVVDLYLSIPDDDGIYYCLPPSQRTRERALQRVAAADSPYEVCLVLVDDAGMIHGEAWYGWSAEQTAQSLFGIYIRRTMQGVGAGRILMTRLMEVGDLYGPPVMTLTVQTENERAWKLYQRMGFIIQRQQMRDAREDSPAMPEFYMTRKMGRRCRAGAASRIITPTLGMHLQGQLHIREMTSVRDPLEINLLYLANRETGICLVSLDHSGVMGSEHIARLRSTVAEETGLPREHVLIASTHTHTAATIQSTLYDSPDNLSYFTTVLEQLTEAAREAVTNARPAEIGTATGRAHIGYNRRLCWEDGSHTMYGDSTAPGFTGLEGPDDPTHTVLFARDEAGKIIAICHNNAAHSTCVECALFASADFPGEARRLIREALAEEVPVLYLQGASGDLSPWNMLRQPARYAGEQRLHEVGAMLAAETLRLQREVEYIADPLILVEHAEPVMGVRLPTDAELAAARETQAHGEEAVGRWQYIIDVCGVLRLWEDYHEAPRETVPLCAVRIGDLAIATNPFEMYCQYGLDIRRRSPARHQMIAQLTNDFLGYLPTIYGILGGGYSGQAIHWARMEPYTGYQIVEETARLLYRLWGQNADHSTPA
jgi:ribosomal protein S18 acetylase RimI-like enzyme/cation transport regulator ChaC